mgnify:CR=1 FL=1
MANPNILNATSIVGKSKALTLGTSATTILTAGSNELIKIKSLIVANNTGNSTQSFNARWRDDSETTQYYLARDVTVPFDSTLMFIGTDFPLYLEESDYIQVWASGTGIDATISYEVLS